MFDLIKSNLLAPLGTRLGSLATGALIGIGANAAHADWVGTGIAGAFLIAADLGLAWLRDRSIATKADNAGFVRGALGAEQGWAQPVSRK